MSYKQQSLPLEIAKAGVDYFLLIDLQYKCNKKRMTHKATRVIIWESPHSHKTGESNMCHYTHFTTEEREKSIVLKAQWLSIRAIAKELGRSPSSASREFRSNCYANGDYAAHYADKRYRKRRKNCGRKAKLMDDAIRDYVIENMILRWSPEQIAGRAKRDKKRSVFHFRQFTVQLIQAFYRRN